MILRKEEFSFRNMLEQINMMVMTQCSDKGLKYECRMTGGVADFYIGDDMKLKQVLLNILSNAIKFTSAPGNIVMTVERTAVFEDQSTIKYTIADTGIGMEKSFIPKVFDSFTQEDSSRNNKYGSTGLGMAITKNIVDIMNGTISVDSEKGKGTEFTVVVTLKNCDRNLSETFFINPKDMRVLVVDDEEVAAEHARIVLDEAGIKADTALSGQDAMHMLEVQHLKKEPYNLVLLDWRMPEMDGLEATKTIRKLERPDSKTVPIIAMTANAFDEDVQRSLQAGMNAHLSKPVEPERLYRTLEELIWEAKNIAESALQ